MIDFRHCFPKSFFPIQTLSLSLSHFRYILFLDPIHCFHLKYLYRQVADIEIVVSIRRTIAHDCYSLDKIIQKWFCQSIQTFNGRFNSFYFFLVMFECKLSILWWIFPALVHSLFYWYCVPLCIFLFSIWKDREKKFNHFSKPSILEIWHVCSMSIYWH